MSQLWWHRTSEERCPRNVTSTITLDFLNRRIDMSVFVAVLRWYSNSKKSHSKAHKRIEGRTKDVKIEHLSFFLFFFLPRSFQAHCQRKLVLHLDMNHKETLGWGEEKKETRGRHVNENRGMGTISPLLIWRHSVGGSMRSTINSLPAVANEE